MAAAAVRRVPYPVSTPTVLPPVSMPTVLPPVSTPTVLPPVSSPSGLGCTLPTAVALSAVVNTGGVPQLDDTAGIPLSADVNTGGVPLPADTAGVPAGAIWNTGGVPQPDDDTAGVPALAGAANTGGVPHLADTTGVPCVPTAAGAENTGGVPHLADTAGVPASAGAVALAVEDPEDVDSDATVEDEEWGGEERGDDNDVCPRETPPHIRIARASPQRHTAAGTAAPTTADTQNTVPQRATTPEYGYGPRVYDDVEYLD